MNKLKILCFSLMLASSFVNGSAAIPSFRRALSNAIQNFSKSKSTIIKNLQKTLKSNQAKLENATTVEQEKNIDQSIIKSIQNVLDSSKKLHLNTKKMLQDALKDLQKAFDAKYHS